MSGWYVLDQKGEPRSASVEEWTGWRRENHADWIIGRFEFPDGVLVSTVFLGLDHSFCSGPPVLFETMIFEGKWNDYQWRWHTRAEAVAAHDRIVAALRTGEAPEDADR